MSVLQHYSVIATTKNMNVYMRTAEWIKENFQNDFERDLFANARRYKGQQYSITLSPDGAYQRSENRDRLNIVRKEFIKHLESWTEELADNPWQWIEVEFGELGPKILSSNPREALI